MDERNERFVVTALVATVTALVVVLVVAVLVWSQDGPGMHRGRMMGGWDGADRHAVVLTDHHVVRHDRQDVRWMREHCPMLGTKVLRVGPDARSGGR